MHIRTRCGWEEGEEELLFSEVKRARECKKPLKSVFCSVAKLTGRKPNSVRNYYYMRIKTMDKSGEFFETATAFVPFSTDEVREMLRFILSKQASGMSVRACTMELGKNDTAQMLRYQNKYRAVIKNNKELVYSVIAELEAEGITAHNPYMQMSAKRGSAASKHDKCELVELVSETVSYLNNVEGVDVVALFTNLGALAKSADTGANTQKKLREAELSGNNDIMAICDENRELREKTEVDAIELKSLRERYGMLYAMFKQLMSVNREFLGMTSVSKMSSLGNYIKELSQNVESFEHNMLEYAR